jgi:hypothetical protein
VLARRFALMTACPLAALALFACAKGTTLAGGSGGGGGDDSSSSTEQASSSSAGPGSGGGGGASSSSSSSSGAGGGGPNALLPLFLLRIGDGVSTLTSAAAPVFVERRLSDGSAAPGGPGTIALPTTSSGGNLPLTLSGTATSEGNLSLSANGNFVFLAGYAAGVGTPSVASSTSDIIPRVVGRIDSTFQIDTTTVLGAAFSGSNVRGATSPDGSTLFVSGNSTSGAGGIQYANLGVPGSTQILADPSNTRCVHIAAGKLYATSGAGTFTNVFSIGLGLPTSPGQTAQSLPGLPTSLASPYSFALLDRSPGVSGVDTLYVADDRSAASGGGIQKWIFDGVSWAFETSFSDGTSGVRGLAAMVSGAGVRIVATTSEASENKLITVFDDNVTPPAVALIAIAAPNTAYRGVAFAPQ